MIVLKRLHDKLTGFVIGHTGRDIPPGVLVADVDLLLLVRFFLIHDGFDDFRSELAFSGEVSHLDRLSM